MSQCPSETNPGHTVSQFMLQLSSSSSLLSHHLPLLNLPSAISSQLGWFWTDRVFHTMLHIILITTTSKQRDFSPRIFSKKPAISSPKQLRKNKNQTFKQWLNHSLDNNSNSVVQTPWVHNPRGCYILWQSHWNTIYKREGLLPFTWMKPKHWKKLIVWNMPAQKTSQSNHSNQISEKKLSCYGEALPDKEKTSASVSLLNPALSVV